VSAAVCAKTGSRVQVGWRFSIQDRLQHGQYQRRDCAAVVERVRVAKLLGCQLRTREPWGWQSLENGLSLFKKMRRRHRILPGKAFQQPEAAWYLKQGGKFGMRACVSQLLPLGLQRLALCCAVGDAAIELFKCGAQGIGHASLPQSGINRGYINQHRGGKARRPALQCGQRSMLGGCQFLDAKALQWRVCSCALIALAQALPQRRKRLAAKQALQAIISAHC